MSQVFFQESYIINYLSKYKPLQKFHNAGIGLPGRFYNKVFAVGDMKILNLQIFIFYSFSISDDSDLHSCG